MDREHQNDRTSQSGPEVPDLTPRRARRTSPSRGAQERMEELRYRTARVEASFDEDEEMYGAEAADIGRAGRRSAASGGNAAASRRGSTGASSQRRASGAEASGARRRTSAGAGASEVNRRTSASRGPQRRARGKKKGKRILSVLLVLVLLIGGFFAYSVIRSLGKPKYWTVAVFGVDSRDGNLGAGALSDVIMLASINRRSGDINLTSVYRDSYLEIDDEGTYHKINEAYFKGGPEQAIAALERNFDLTIDDYVTFNWKAVAEGITMLGGVDLDISDAEFAYINAFITETVEGTGLGSYQLEKSGLNHLDGVQAVAYARLRLMDTDFKRTARQRQVLELAMQKAKTASKKTLAATALTVMQDIRTSIGADDLLDIAKTVKKYNIQNAVGFPFSRDTTNVGKMNVVVPATLASNVVQLHTFLYGDDAADYTLSDTVQQISDHIEKKTGIGELENADIPKLGGGTGVTKAAETENAKAEKSTKAQTAAETKQSETTEAVKETESSEESTIEELETSEASESKESTASSKETASDGTSASGGSSEKETTKKETASKESESDGPGETEVGPVAPPQESEVGPVPVFD